MDDPRKSPYSSKTLMFCKAIGIYFIFNMGHNKTPLFCMYYVPGFCEKEHLSRPLLEDAQQAPQLLIIPNIKQKGGKKRNQLLKGSRKQ